jgi:hypothetical protein
MQENRVSLTGGKEMKNIDGYVGRCPDCGHLGQLITGTTARGTYSILTERATTDNVR